MTLSRYRADCQEGSVSPALRCDGQLSRDFDVGNVAPRMQCLPREHEIEEAAIVREELNVPAAEHVLENGGRELDLPATCNPDRVLEEAVKVIGRTHDVLTVTLQCANP